MAQRRKTVPARKPRDRSSVDDALLFRSAEALGRVIGALQRQLDDATRRLSNHTSAKKKTAGAKKKAAKS